MTKVIGVTGGIAAGKSTVMHFFEEKKIPVIYADIGAREVVALGTEGLKKIEATFGSQVIQADGTLDRKELGTLIFSDKNKREQLNDLLRTDIRQWISQKIDDAKSSDPQVVVVEIPLLYEENYEEMVDMVMLIDLDEQTQKERLMSRNHLSEEAAIQRIHSQWPAEEKRKKADVIIDNQGTKQETYQKLDQWLNELLSRNESFDYNVME